MGVAVVLLNKQERRHKVAVVGEWGGSWKSWVRILLKIYCIELQKNW